MRVYLRVETDDIDEVRSLREWLADEPKVRRHGNLRYADRSGADTMGPGLDILTLVISSGLSVAQLVLAVAQWRLSRAARPAVSIVEAAPDSRTIVIDTSDPQGLADILRQLDEK